MCRRPASTCERRRQPPPRPCCTSAPLPSPPSCSAAPCRFERGHLGGRAEEVEVDGLTLELGERRPAGGTAAPPPAAAPATPLLPHPQATLAPSFLQWRDRPAAAPTIRPQSRPGYGAGASIVWEKNYLMRDLVAAAGLEREELQDGGLLAVYDGQVGACSACCMVAADACRIAQEACRIARAWRGACAWRGGFARACARPCPLFQSLAPPHTALSPTDPGV